MAFQVRAIHPNTTRTWFHHKGMGLTDNLGDEVRGAYMQRLMSRCAKAEAPFDWIVIMGGTNDFGYGQPPPAIYQSLRKNTASIIGV